MKTKLLFSAMLAVLLAFGLVFVSCDDGSGSNIAPPKIPRVFTGEWGTPTPLLVINANGTGTIFYNFDPVHACTYEHSKEGSVDKLTIIFADGLECTYDVSINSDGNLLLANPTDSAFEFYSNASPYPKYEAPDISGTIPVELVGSWKATNGDFSGMVVFVINNTNPQVLLSGTGTLSPCLWDSESTGKITLEWDGTSFGLGVLTCTFDYEIDGDGNLVLSNADGSAILAGYIPWGPFVKAE